MIDLLIKQFLATYRSSYLHSRIAPKMHILEDHVIHWLMKYHHGFGLFGEQRFQYIHARINTIASSMSRIQNYKILLTA